MIIVVLLLLFTSTHHDILATVAQVVERLPTNQKGGGVGSIPGSIPHVKILGKVLKPKLPLMFVSSVYECVGV